MTIQETKVVMQCQHMALEAMAYKLSCVQRYNLGHQVTFGKLVRADADAILDGARLLGTVEWDQLSAVLELRMQDWRPPLYTVEAQEECEARE